MEYLQDVGGETGGGPGGEDALGRGGSLWGGFEENGVSAENGREDRVDRGEVGKVPRRDDAEMSGVVWDAHPTRPRGCLLIIIFMLTPSATSWGMGLRQSLAILIKCRAL